MRILNRKTLVVLVVLGTLLAGCGGTASPATQTPEAPAATETPTTVPERLLTICLGQEPESLYIYNNNGRTMWSVLEALYDGPIDTIDYAAQPVILDELPTLENGGLTFESVPVVAGDIVIDANGDRIALQQGVTVFPSGCTQASCAVAWDGTSALTMDRMTAMFRLRTGITWSDGEPLTAADSVYSWQIASDPASPVVRTQLERTAGYQTLDETTVQWTSIPGLVTDDVSLFFWIPLPQHELEGLSAADLQTSELTNRQPLGWGAYMLDEWVAGDHIRMVRNPLYFRAGERLPNFDVLVFRFLGEHADGNLDALLVGECDVVDQTTLLEEQYQSVRQAQLDGHLAVYAGLGPNWENLAIGIRPASYDDGYNPYGVDRADFFGDVRVRQAMAQCIDREGIVEEVYHNLTTVADGYLPPDHPDYAQDMPTYAYDPAAASALLEGMGWRDLDGDVTTPRVAYGVANVPDGTPFVISLAASGADLRQQAAEIVAESLGQCGIQVNVTETDSASLYGAGPNGLLFGRQFDLAEIAWRVSGSPPCFIYMSAEIPNAANSWVGSRHGGANLAGYSNPALDAACTAALNAGLDAAAARTAQQEAQRILATDLPFIPLFYIPELAVSRPDMCGMSMDISARSEFWNLEALDYGEGCE